ncbi:hypothetical protein GNI_057750 [Gregarina niphandrodes]|uniref:Uncharacterized protein n=1 Tax=Gregarina niphandrodes TaxID=110365 RepID=A0A023B8R9_GRENI|nr:hypothetical protein GNI_057750 [Gregarina niphandrodes]EZG69533.1 hypothetical protein GNI_057750 [Gregarina niphandrodes]|eukprot:XP_011130006.1 hypothetical protein GNI_057750 [Gregarina niphandrodes]
MREALSKETCGLSEKRINRVVKADLKRVAEDFFSPYGRLCKKLVDESVNKVVRMQHQLSPEHQAAWSSDDPWSSAVILPSADTRKVTRRLWKSDSDAFFQLCKNVHVDWTKLPEAVATAAKVFLVDVAATGNVEAAAVQTMAHFCASGYVQFLMRPSGNGPRGSIEPWTPECEHTALRLEHTLYEKGCSRLDIWAQGCDVLQQICGNIIARSIPPDSEQFIESLPAPVGYHVYVLETVHENGTFLFDPTNQGASWCFKRYSDEL